MGCLGVRFRCLSRPRICQLLVPLSLSLLCFSFICWFLSCLSSFPYLRLAQSLFALFASSLAISLVFAIIPLCHNVVVLAVVMAVAGLAMGCIDTISNMQLVKIYQKDSAIFLQALHFFVGFGALLSPLIADPFLSDTNCILSNATANASSNLPHIRKSLVPHHPGNLSHYDLPMKGMVVTHVSYAFWIMALINLPVPIAVFFLLYKERMVPCFNSSSHPLLSADELAMETRPAEKDDLSTTVQRPQTARGHDDLFSCCQSKNFRGASYTYFAVHITGALVLFMTDGIVGEYSGFIYSYAVEEPLSVVHKVAGYLPSLFWGFITLGRLISIPVSYRMKPATMVFINVVGVLVTFLLLLIFSYSVVFLFVGTACLGLFLSSTFPSMLAYTEDILQYKGKQGCGHTWLTLKAGGCSGLELRYPLYLVSPLPCSGIPGKTTRCTSEDNFSFSALDRNIH
uniref:Major facilitator superfamily domain-containing protein 4A n=1 Tax=Apteryx owenii TaxID=8824 RepID=A0A8B9PRQ1_APTOW